MEEKTYRNHLHKKLCKLFLFTKFIQPNFIRGEIVKHLELSDENVEVGKVQTEENSLSMPIKVTFEDNKQEFLFTFSKRVEEPKEIDVPKIVNRERKWYEFGDPKKEVIVEKKMTKQQDYWLLTSIK